MKNAGKDVEKREPLGTGGGNADWCSHSVWRGPQKIKNRTTVDPAIPLLGIQSKAMKSLFTIAKVWKQPQYLWMDKWVK